MKKIKGLIFISVLASSLSFYATNAVSLTKGEDTANDIQSNYNKIVTNCGSSSQPAFLCSGVLIRATVPNTDYNSWDPSPASVTSGGVSFSYLRKDTKTYTLFDGVENGNGLIFFPHKYVPIDKTADIEVLCSFPVNASTNVRPDKGCGGSSPRTKACQSIGILNASQWQTNYQVYNSICGFDVSKGSIYDISDAFYQTISAMNLINYNRHNELRLATWNTKAANYPNNLPIEAFFYTAKGVPRAAIPKGLTGAQHDQETFYKKTGTWIPIIKLTLATNTSDAKFEYQAQDQKINEPSLSKGETVANYMTSNYKKTVSNCNSTSKPAFMCSGIMLRAVNPDTDYNSWDPSPASVTSGGVSFSYLRADAKFNKLAYGYLNGFVLFPHDYVPQGENRDIEVLCSFPLDAGTDMRADKGCGANKNYPTSSGVCQKQGIFNADGWVNHFNQITGDEAKKRAHQCGFDVSINNQFNSSVGFYQSILAIGKIPNLSIKTQNEIRLGTWNTKASGYPKTLPIEAFFYIYNQAGGMPRTAIAKGLTAAKVDQKNYFNQTGKWIPIIRVSLPMTISDDAKFEYSTIDQEISEGQTPPPVMPGKVVLEGDLELDGLSGIIGSQNSILGGFKFIKGKTYSLYIDKHSELKVYSCPNNTLFNIPNASCAFLDLNRELILDNFNISGQSMLCSKEGDLSRTYIYSNVKRKIHFILKELN